MRTFTLLLLDHARGQHHRGGALALEVGVMPGVTLELLVVDVDDDVNYAVEEIAVMRHDHQRALILLQPLLHPQDGIEVQMVGRFVEQQQVRRTHQCLREVEPHAPAAGETGYRILHLVMAEAEAVQQAFGARTHGPRIGVGQVGVDRADAFTVIGGFGLGEFGFEIAQRSVAVDGVINR